MKHMQNKQARQKMKLIITASCLLVFFNNCDSGMSVKGSVNSTSSTLGQTPSTGTGSGTGTGTTTNPMGTAAAARLLNQGTFGASMTDIQNASNMSYDQWFTQQQAYSPSLELPYFTVANMLSAYAVPSFDGIPGIIRDEIWLNNVLTGQDQLRQRMAFALSEIIVVSSNSNSGYNAGVPAVAGFMDLLATDSFGNFRQLLTDVTLNSYMGIWLTMAGNQGTGLPSGVHADENYAREIMQLFSVGLNMLNIDGSLQLDSNGNPIPAYTQAQVEDLARVFTGWDLTSNGSWAPNNPGAVPLLNSTGTALMQMIAYPSMHDSTTKTIIGGTVIPAGLSAAQDLQKALDTIFSHPNVGPFISKQLIEKLVTSNPSPAYVGRVATIFNNDGTGTRGNLAAVVKGILTDSEAINGTTVNVGFGKLREPILKMTHLYRAFNATAPALNTVNYNNFYSGFLGGFDGFYWPQDALTVFNFFQPSYQPAGTIANAGEIAPEFELITDNTIVSVSNALDNYSGLYQGTVSSGTKSVNNGIDTYQPVLNLTAWEAVAQNPTNLVNQMNLVLMNGMMTTDMQSILVTYASGISNVDQRIADLADLVINSPQYSIQR